MPDHRAGSTSGMSLFPYAMALALSFGATRVIGAVSHSVARLYRRFGLDLCDIGVGTPAACANIVACSIDLDPAAFHKLQCDPVTLLNSITRFGQLPLADPGIPGHSHPTEASAPAATCPSQFGTTERYTRKRQSRRPAPDSSACLQGGNGADCRPPSPSLA